MHQQPPHTPLFASTSRANVAHVSTSKGRTEKAAVVSLAASGSLTGTVSACTQRLVHVVHLFAPEAPLAALAGVPVRVPLRSAGRCLEQDAYKPSRISSAHW